MLNGLAVRTGRDKQREWALRARARKGMDGRPAKSHERTRRASGAQGARLNEQTRAKIVARLQALHRELSTDFRNSASEISTCRDRMGNDDRITVSTSAFVAVGAISHLSHSLAEVEAALKRLTADEYGLCAECGRDIPRHRLLANPTARRCIECQSQVEAAKKRR